MKTIVVKNLLLNYYEEGKNNDTCFIFLHGWGQDCLSFQNFFPFFKEKHFISLDLPGFGKSFLPEDGLSLDEYVEILNDFILKKKLKKVYLIGHSFGGRIAVLYANKYKLNGLVLMSSGGIEEKTLKIKIINKLSKLAKFLPFKKLKNFLFRFLVSEDAFNASKNRGLKKTFKNTVSLDLKDKISNIKQKTLIFWGKEDKTTPLFDGKKFHRLIKGSKFKVFSGNHFFFQVHYKKITKIIFEEFL
jgi:pimeloyl-ACP methyl ester carboxylesterase